jgi:hypothetical protein
MVLYGRKSMTAPNQDPNPRPTAGRSVRRVTPRMLTTSGVIAEVALAAMRLAALRFPSPDPIFPILFWPIMFFLALSWQEKASAWHTALRAAVPVVITSWVLQALLFFLGR